MTIPKKLLLAIAATAAAAQVCAKGSMTSEWGLTAGVRYNWRTMFTGQRQLSLTPAVSYNIGVQAGLCFGEVAVQPELNYGYTAAKARIGEKGGRTVSVKAHDLEIPLLVSLRVLPVVRFNAGPVFNVLSTASYSGGEDGNAMFGALSPTFGYAAGVSAVPTGKLLIDIRFTGYFQRTLNQFEGYDFKTMPYSVGLKIGYLF